MTRTTTNRPRMAAIYAPGTVRARRWHGDGDVRGYRPPSGWMPAIFKAAGPQDAAQEESPVQEAPEDAEAMADEPAEALAA